MKKLVLAVALCIPAAAALAQFEGVAEFQSTVQTEQGKAAMGKSRVFLTKGAYRAESEIDYSAIAKGRKGGDHTAVPPTFKMTMVGKLSDPDKLYLIDDKNKTYSVMDLKKMREWAEDLKDKDAKAKESYTVRKLGKDTVAGLSCQKALLTSSKGSEIEVCMTKEIDASSQWMSAMNRRQRDSISWFGTLKDNGIDGFPIRWSVHPKDSKAESMAMTMELTRFERKSLPASLFDVPPGYKETDSAMAPMSQALEKMTPEQRRAYEDAMKRYGHPTPKP